MMASTTLAYGVWQNYINFNMNLTTAQKPTVSVTCTFPNTHENSVTLFVNQTTKTIESTEPVTPLIYINVTNTGKTPIDKITLNNTIPSDWTLRQVSMQLIQADKTQIEIDAKHFSVGYSSENNIVMITSNIKEALGKPLNQYESIIVNLYIECAIVGQALPMEYETNPPIYINTATVALWIGNWQGAFANATATFISYIYWV
jgi:hypothetical protein